MFGRRGSEKGKELEIILLRRRLELHREGEAGPILRGEVAIKLLKLAQKPINKEIQIRRKRVLQEIHIINKTR